MSPALLIVSLILIAAGLSLIRFLSHRDARSLKTSPDPVLEDFMIALRDCLPGTSLDFDPDKDMIRLDGGEQGTIFLGNMRNQVSEIGREDQRQTIAAFVRIGVAGEDPEPDAIRSGLTLRPRTAEEISLRRVGMGENFTPVMRPSGDLFLDMMCDLGVAMRGMTPDLLQTANIDSETAFALAADNLRAITPTTADALWEEMEPGIWAMRAVDDYSAARMLTFWPDLPLPVSQAGTVHMPTQGTVLLIDGTDQDRQHRLIALGEELAGIQRPLCMRLYAPSEDGFTALHQGHAAALANAIADFRAYDDQVDMLHRMFEDIDEDIFVPKPMVIEYEEQAGSLPQIGCVLIGGGCLLPDVDVLMLPDGDDIVEVPWDAAARLLGPDRLKPYPGLLPVRYDLRDPIPVKIMDAIRATGTRRPTEKTTS